MKSLSSIEKALIELRNHPDIGEPTSLRKNKWVKPNSVRHEIWGNGILVDWDQFDEQKIAIVGYEVQR